MDEASAAGLRGVGLLERSVSYLLGCLHLVTSDDDLEGPTPCRDWDVRTLLDHLDDSLRAMHEAARGHVAVPARLPPSPDRIGGTAPVQSVRTRARQLIGVWLTAAAPSGIGVGGLPLSAGVVCGVGAVEIAVHGWDVAHACGGERAIPPSLAEELAELATVMVTDGDRPHRFDRPVRVSVTAQPGDRLVAFLGRDPYATFTARRRR